MRPRQEIGTAVDDGVFDDAARFRIAQRRIGNKRVLGGGDFHFRGVDLICALEFGKVGIHFKRFVVKSRVGSEVDKHRILDAPRRNISRRVVCRHAESVHAVGYVAKGERRRRDVGFGPLVLLGSAVADLVSRHADVVMGCAPSERRTGGAPLGADALDLIRRFGIDGEKIASGGQVAVNGRAVVARHHEIEGVVAARHVVVGHDILECSRRLGGGKFTDQCAVVFGRVPECAENRNCRVFQRREFAQRVVDRRTTAARAGRYRSDDRLLHGLLEGVCAEGRVFVAVGVERPLAQTGVVDGDGDAVQTGEFIDDLHIVIQPGLDRGLRVLDAVVDQRRRSGGGGDGEGDLEERRTEFGNGVLFAGRGRSPAPQTALVSAFGAREHTQVAALFLHLFPDV